MKILYVAMPYEKGQSGISRYMNETIKQFASMDVEMEVMFNSKDIPFFPEEKDFESFKKVVVNFNFFPGALKIIAEILFHLFILPCWCKLKGYDLLFLPAGNRRLCLFYPIFTITTVHDFCQFHIPNKYDLFRMFYVKRIIPLLLKKVSYISSISKSTAHDLMNELNVDPKLIFINPNGFKNLNSISGTDKENLEKISEDYILYVSRIEHPGKNHLNLMKAYELLPEQRTGTP